MIVPSGLTTSGGEEAVGVPQGERPSGQRKSPVVHPRQSHGARFRHRAPEVLRDVQASEGALDQP